MVYDLDTTSRDLSTEFTLGDFLFGTVKLTKNNDPDKHGYSGYGIESDARSQFSLNGEWSKNLVTFGVDNSLSLHTDKRRKDILVLVERKFVLVCTAMESTVFCMLIM